MNKVILIVFSGLLAVQLVSAQSHTTWAAAQVPGLEGVPVSLLAVPGNSPGLRVMYNALKTDKRILDLLKAGILAPLSNSILFVPGGKTMLQTTKTTVVETMTSESALQDKKSSDVENVKTNAPKENNVIMKPSTQNTGLNLNILGKRLKRVPELADMKLDIAVETNDLPVKKVKIPKRKKSISRKRSRNRVSKRRQSSRKMRPVTRPFKAADVQPFQKPMEKIGTISSQRRPIYKQYIERPSKIVRTDIVQEASVPRVVNVALDYDSKALTDTLLVMLKTMHMIQKYIKDSLTTTTTTTTPSTTTTPTTTTTTKTTTTTRPTTTLPYYRILSTVPTTTPTTTTPSPITEATTTEFYMTDMTTTDFETTTEDYALVDSSANNKANSELAPDVVDFIQAFKKAIKLAKKKPEKPKKPQGADKLTQLHKLLEGISPSQLQTLVDLIKAKANEGKPKPLPKPEPLPKPKPIFAPPPPPVNRPRWQVPRGTNNLHGQQNSWKPNPFHIPSIQTNANDQQQPRNAPKWQQKRRNMFNSRRKQQQFQRKQERMDVKGPGKNRQSVSPGSLSTTDVLGKFKPTQQTWQITKGQPKMPRRNNNRGISVGFPQPNKKPNRPNRPNNRGQGKKPQGPKGGGQTIGDMIQNMFKGGAPPGAAGGMPNMPGPLAGGGDAAGLGALLGLGESGGMPMMPPGQSGAGGLEALLAMGGGSGQGAGGGEGLGGLGALMGLGGAGGSGSNPLEALLGAGGRGPGSNPLEALMGAGGAGAGGNPLEALLGPGGTGTGSNPLEALMGAGGAGASGNPLEALLGPGGAGGGSNPLDALLGAGGAASSNALGAIFGKEKPGKKGKPGRGRPPFGKPFRPPKGGPGSMFPFLGRNPMGPGRPLIPGMTPGQVSDLMGGRPGPVPMDIAHQADLMSKMGHTVDHIVDVLGDVLQHRRSMPGYAAAALAAGSFPGMGIGNAGSPGKPGRKQGRHV